jgi:translation elongation factor EF-G
VAYVRVFSGALRSGMDVLVPRRTPKDKIGGMYLIMGKHRDDVSVAARGEMGGLVKLKSARRPEHSAVNVTPSTVTPT